MKNKINKWIKEYIIQEFTGDGYGWEDSTAESTIKESRARLKEYRENSICPSRLITRRIINSEWKGE